MQLEVTDRPPGEPPAGALLMLPLFGLPLGAWLFQHGYIAFGTCGMKRLADIPCLMCGATRATIHLLDGNLLTAISLQPMVIFGYALLAGVGIVSTSTFFSDQSLEIDLTSAEAAVLKLAIISLPLLNWAYLIATDV